MHVGICGYAESGKDEVANVLVQDIGFVSIGMSDALDKYLLILDPWIDMCGYFERYSDIRKRLTYVRAKEIPEVRRLLQRLGTEVGRAIDPDMWVKELRKSAKSAMKYVVTTGIRYQNEVDIVDRLIWVDRPGKGPLNDHSSEDLGHIFAQADYSIVNDGSLKDLEKKTLSKWTEIRRDYEN